MEGASMEVALTNLVDALKRMSELIYGEVKFPSGCTLQLEIKQGASALWPHLPEK
jgi:transcription termination factor Rho